MSKSKLHDLLRLSWVPRWTTIPTTRPQSVAEHSFRVAAITMYLIERLPMKGSTFAVRWALCHDGPECETGDIPSTVKDFFTLKDILSDVEMAVCPWYRREEGIPSSDERMIVKLADHLETYMFISEHIAHPLEDGWVIARERQIVTNIVENARSRYGWSELPAIVDEILSTVNFCEASAYKPDDGGDNQKSPGAEPHLSPGTKDGHNKQNDPGNL